MNAFDFREEADNVDFDREMELEDAGIDAFEFSLMDDDERIEALTDAGLDPEDYDSIELDDSFQAWSDLQDAGLSLNEIEYMNDEEKQKQLEDAGLDPHDYDSSPLWPSTVRTTNPVPHVKSNGAVLHNTAKTQPVPGCIRPEATKTNSYASDDGKVPEKRGSHFLAYFAAAIICVLIVVIAVESGGNSRYSSVAPSPSHSYSRSTSSTGQSISSSYSGAKVNSPTQTKPPVNRELAMTKEEADRLRGTGYHGCRPNSSAENTELAAAQTKCKNCGYRTHNGSNSLCDYCRWMERYGGGLPASTSTPKPTTTPKPMPMPKSKASPTPKPSDPYGAGDYSHPDDFYYDHYDDFWDYEDAEDYWDEYN